MRTTEIGLGGNSAEYCRRNGWTVGTRLVGNEGAGPTTIEITAIGESTILAKRIDPPHGRESSWTLACRDWKVVALPGEEG